MDDNNIGAINVVEDIPWKHSEEPEELIEGKGFRLFESVHNAKVNEAGQLNRVQTMEAVFTSTFSRLFYGFSDFLTFMIEKDVYNDVGELLAQYVDSIEYIAGGTKPLDGCAFKAIYWLESNDSVKMEINSDEVREHLNFSDPDKLDKLKFCEELVLFRSRKSCEMLIEQMQNIMVPRNWTTNCHKYSEHGIIKNERKEQIPCHAEVITQLNSRPKSFLKYLRKRRSLAS